MFNYPCWCEYCQLFSFNLVPHTVDVSYQDLSERVNRVTVQAKLPTCERCSKVNFDDTSDLERAIAQAVHGGCVHILSANVVGESRQGTPDAARAASPSSAPGSLLAVALEDWESEKLGEMIATFSTDLLLRQDETAEAEVYIVADLLKKFRKGLANIEEVKKHLSTLDQQP